MDKEFKTCIIASSPNVSMNTELTQFLVNKGLGSFSFCCQHLLWGSYECHIKEIFKSALHAEIQADTN